MGLKKKDIESMVKLHGKPVTRRDFLSTGLIPFSASLIMPSWLTMFANSGLAQAQEIQCKVTKGVQLCPFIGLKLSGGGALAANFIPHDKGKQLLSSYSKMGLGTGANLANKIQYEFANKAPFYVNSGLLRGLRAELITRLNSSVTFEKSTFVGVPLRSQDDSAMNKFDITGLVARAGLAGKILPNLGRVNTDTGVAAVSAYTRPPAPLIVSGFQDIEGSLQLGNRLSMLSNKQQSDLFKAINKLSSSQSRKLASTTNGWKAVSKLSQCAMSDNSELVSGSALGSIDPLSNAAFANIWNITANTAKNSQDYVFATLVFNAVNGNAGTVNLEMGGFDYHNNTRTTGDGQDAAAGAVIAKILQSFAVLGKKGFIMVTSDGSVTSAESDTDGGGWVSDRGTAGCAYMLTYDPEMNTKAKSFQLGQFVEGQVADDNFITGGSAEIGAAGIFANYMSVNNNIAKLEDALPRVFTSTDLDKVLIY